MANSFKIFRVTLQVSNLEKAVQFYSELLDDEGTSIRGSRHYFDCGGVILAILDPTQGGIKAKPIPEYVYFSVKNLKQVHERAKKLGCLSKDDVHGESAAEIIKRPWGEKSFYVEDPFGNGLCFVDEKTLFAGR